MQKHALVIGGTRGLGKVTAKLLGAEGHKITILARNKPNASDQNNQDFFYIQADLKEQGSYLKKLSETIQARGKLNYLIFLQRYRGEGDCWAEELEVTVNATRQIIDHLKDEFCTANDSDTSIVIVSSIAGKLATTSQPISYSVAKAGLNQIVKHYALQLGAYGIRVNAVSPFSFIKKESRQFYLENKELLTLYQKIIPLKRMCTAEDVANVISFLCSSKASFISGQNILVDGGLSIINHELLARTVKDI